MRHEADVSPFPTHVRSLPSGHPTPKKAFLGTVNMEKNKPQLFPNASRSATETL